MHRKLILFTLCLCALTTNQALAKECWGITDMKGQTAFSDEHYAFQSDGIKNPMVLCLDDKAGSVSGDDTEFVRFGESTLAGYAFNNGAELFEVYQLDRPGNRVLFTKTRIGTTNIIPGAPDLVGSFVGKATRLPK